MGWTQIAMVMPQPLVRPIIATIAFAAPKPPEAALLTTIVVKPQLAIAPAGHACSQLNLEVLVNCVNLVQANNNFTVQNHLDSTILGWQEIPKTYMGAILIDVQISL